MNTVFEFIRYGFPGYITLGTISYQAVKLDLLPSQKSTMEQLSTVFGASFLIVGPIIGFIIHQIYFAYFEKSESYTNENRACVKTLYEHCKSRHPDVKSETLLRYCYLSWKYIMIGAIKKIEVPTILLNRLGGMRNYTHAFGAIITSLVIAILLIFIGATISKSFTLVDASILAFFCVILIVFSVQRSQLMARLNSLEDGYMRFNIDIFSDGVSEIIEKIEPKKIDEIKHTGSYPSM